MSEMTAIDAVFRPKRIAVLGASADPTKFGHHLVRNLQTFKFPGDVYPISRSSPEICGYRTFASLKDIPNEIDLVLVSIPSTAVPASIGDAVAVSAKAAVVFTAGFQEIGEEGRQLQQDMLAKADGRIRMIGPNCLGIRNFHLPMNASPMPHAALEPGPIAFISQSGAFGNAAIAALRNARLGLSKLASIGNMADLTHAHLFRYFAEDPETTVITAFVEGVPNVPDFLDNIAEVSRKKPIIILKGGRSKSGQRAALSHTGSLAGDGRVWESLLREAGAVFVELQRGAVRRRGGLRALRQQPAERQPHGDLCAGRRAERGRGGPLRSVRHRIAAPRRETAVTAPDRSPVRGAGKSGRGYRSDQARASQHLCAGDYYPAEHRIR